MLRARRTPFRKAASPRKWPDGEQMSIYDAAMTFQEAPGAAGVSPARIRQRLVERLWCEGHPAARAFARICQSFERNSTRCTWSAMGVLPLNFRGKATHGLAGPEAATRRSRSGLAATHARQTLTAGKSSTATARCGAYRCSARIDTRRARILPNGGILQYVLRNLAADVDCDRASLRSE